MIPTVKCEPVLILLHICIFDFGTASNYLIGLKFYNAEI